MKKVNLTISMIITLSSGLSFAMKTKGDMVRDFTLPINDARNEQKDHLKSFQAELKSNKEVTIEEAEVIEFLNSEIRWKSPRQNANK